MTACTDTNNFCIPFKSATNWDTSYQPPDMLPRPRFFKLTTPARRFRTFNIFHPTAFKQSQCLPIRCRPRIQPTTLTYSPTAFTTRHFTTSSTSTRSLKLSAVLLTTLSLAILFYGLGYYYVYILRSLSTYPVSVASELRRAIYYSTNNRDIKKAAEYLVSALEKARECGMDPLSKEVTGIKIELARLCEENGRRDKAVEILSGLKGDFEKGIKRLEELKGKGEKKVQMNTGFVDKEGNQMVKVEEISKFRTELLKRVLGVAVKLGELFGQMGKVGEKGKVLVEAVERALKETMERDKAELSTGDVDQSDKSRIDSNMQSAIGDVQQQAESEGQAQSKEGEWLTAKELSSLLESLASHYESTNQFLLATPLYLHCLTLLPKESCSAITIMNNVAASISQQPLPVDSSISRNDLVQMAATWAQKALEMSSKIRPPERTAECDHACVAAMCNLGDFYLMLEEKGKAEKMFLEARDFAQEVQNREGVRTAEEGLKKVKEGNV